MRRLMSAWRHDLQHAARTFRRRPAFTALAVVTLALGIGANSAIFSVVEHVLLNGLPYRQPDRLVSLAADDTATLHPSNVSYGLVHDWRARVHTLSAIAMIRDWTPTLDADEGAEALDGERVSWNYFPTLGVAPALGRAFTQDEDRPDRWHVVLLSNDLWRSRFGARPDIVGRTIHLNGTPYEVAGVMPAGYRPLPGVSESNHPQLWAPLGYDMSLPNACRSCQHLRAIARLADGATLAGVRAEMNTVASALAREYPNDYPTDASVVVTPLLDHVVQDVRRALWLVLGATGLVLLVASVNVANLLLVAAAGRRRELALRAALGASRGRLVAQMLTESLLLTLFGGAAGLLVAVWGIEAVKLWAPAGIPRLDEVRMDPGVLASTLLICLVTATLAGLLPAWQAARADPRDALQDGARGTAGTAHSRSRRGLVVAEIALAFVLAAGTGLLARSLVQVLQSNPGFDTHDLYTANVSLVGPQWADDAPVQQFDDQMLAGVRALPGVEHAALVSTLPLSGSYDRRDFHIQDRPLPNPSAAPPIDSYYVTPGYFRTMGIPLLRGRLFTDADLAASATTPVAIISETTARQMWPGEDPVGKRIQLGGRHEDEPWATIVGIVPDVRQYTLDAAPTADAYLLERAMSFPTLIVRSGVAPDVLTREVKAVTARLDKTVPVYGVATMEQLVAATVAQRRFVAALVAGFGLLALLLAGVGIFGVMAYAVVQRTGEIGVRMALGATPGTILRLVAGEAAILGILGAAAGLALALGLVRLIESQLYQVTPADPVAFGGALTAVAVVVLAACWLPVRRATKVSPLDALRYE